MVDRNKMPSQMERIKFGVKQYLSETTAHGLRYLVEGRNIFERVVWSIIISSSFTLALFWIHSSFQGAYDSPIITSIETTEIQKVSQVRNIKG